MRRGLFQRLLVARGVRGTEVPPRGILASRVDGPGMDSRGGAHTGPDGPLADPRIPQLGSGQGEGRPSGAGVGTPDYRVRSPRWAETPIPRPGPQ